MDKKIQECEKILKYTFKDKQLIRKALTHSSSTAERNTQDYERLEFLGDSVLNFIVCDFLFRKNPHFEEGELTKIKSFVVSGTVLAEVSQRLGLSKYLIMGKALSHRGTVPASIDEDLFEAVIGAIYLDGGLHKARDFVFRFMTDDIIQVMRDKSVRNYKSVLQEYVQRTYGEIPVYKVIKEEGPDHLKEFYVTVAVDGKTVGRGFGKSKKDAQQLAAKDALEKISHS